MFSSLIFPSTWPYNFFHLNVLVHCFADRFIISPSLMAKLLWPAWFVMANFVCTGQLSLKWLTTLCWTFYIQLFNHYTLILCQKMCVDQHSLIRLIETCLFWFEWSTQFKFQNKRAPFITEFLFTFIFLQQQYLFYILQK